MIEFGKLVRDKIPQIIRADGRTPVVEVLPSSRRRPALLEKLLEEAAEAASASHDELPGELADVLEVLRALAAELGKSFDDIVALADTKREQRGGFDEGVFLVRVESNGAAPG